MVTKAQLQAQARYDKRNTKQIILKLNIHSDADILAKLEDENSKQGYIKELVRKDMRDVVSVLTVDSIRYLLLPIVNKYAINSVSLFGSYARNEAKPESDIDLVIDGGNYKGLFEYAAMIDEMKNALGRDVDVITQKSLERATSKSDLLFKSNVERDRVLLI